MVYRSMLRDVKKKKRKKKEEGGGVRYKDKNENKWWLHHQLQALHELVHRNTFCCLVVK